MKQLPIAWQRLVNAEGKTCDRCGATHEQMLRALEKLKAALRPLGIEPTLELKKMDQAAFKVTPSESNRIWIAGKPMERWLGARVGSSPCCSVCGGSECRTVEIGSTIYEAIPETLLIKAALAAAAQLLDEVPSPSPRLDSTPIGPALAQEVAGKCAEGCAHDLGADEGRDMPRTDSRACCAEAASERDRRVGERG